MFVQLIVVIGCRAGDDPRTQWQDRRAEWERQANGLTQRCDAALERLRQAAARPADPKTGANAKAEARRAQLDVVVQGTRQSLQDLTLSVGQRSRDIDALIARAPEGASAAIEQETTRVVEVLRMLGKQLETAEAALARPDRG